tara:strand:+ start:265 stop:675 length:411 start_codon:yes stop_codon:yes gene_type:complete
MPLIQSSRNISPLDINKNVSIGVAFPLDSTNMFKGTQTVKEQIKSNLLNVLLTEKGERVNEPNFGVGLKGLLFENNPDTEFLKEEINTQIQVHIPEITLLDVLADFIADQHILYIKIMYRFNLDGSEDSIQLNFNE